MTAETVAPALSRDQIEAKLIDLADACSRVPLRFFMVTCGWSDAGAEDQPQDVRVLRTAGCRGNGAPSPRRSSRSRDRSAEERQAPEDHRVDGSES